MRRPSLVSGASTLLMLAAVAQAHQGAHEQLESIHKRHRESRLKRIAESSAREEDARDLARRGGQCQFPTDAGLVAVTPGATNAGWAMSPDQPCLPGNYCPYACPPGQVSLQWDPKATSYTYPLSMHGGLYCDSNGQVNKPFPDKAYCEPTTNNIGVVNNATASVAFCQTVLPGNEAMLIPTAVDGYSTLAVPGTDYWASTAAHYYINPPGTAVDDACAWGSSSNPFGNWSPYVAGTNMDDTGRTYIKLGWNPVYLEPATPFRNVMPSWGVKIDCPGGECGGLPCQIDPDYNKVNGMKGDVSIGAGAATFCVVSVPKGATANFVVFGGDAGSSASASTTSVSAKGGQFYQSTSVAPSSSSSSTTSSTTKALKTTSTTTSSPLVVTSSSTTVASTTATSTTTPASTSASTSATSTITGGSSSSWSNWNSQSSTGSNTGSSSVTSNSGSSTTSWTATGSTSVSGPTGQPYYSLFNTSAAPTSALLAAQSSAESSISATMASSVPMASSTGGATSLTWSFAAIAPLAMWVLFV